MAVSFEELCADDINNLVLNGLAEGLSVEFKEVLKLDNSQQKKKFLEQVCSMANSAGGRIFYGIAEKRQDNKPTGIAGKAVGLIEFHQEDLAKITQIILEGIAPRLNGVRVKEITGSFEHGSIVVVEVPKSWKPPHMVSFEHSSKFCARDDRGKYNMDVYQIGDAFLASESVGSRVREFRAERLATISAGEGPFLISPRYLAVHLVPISSLSNRSTFPMQQLETACGHDLKPMFAGYGGWNEKKNLDGFLRFAVSQETKRALGYSMLFRNGIIEACDSLIAGGESRAKQIQGVEIERELIRNLGSFIKIQTALGIKPPVVLMVSLIRVAGVRLADGGKNIVIPGMQSHEFDRDRLLFDEVIIDDICQPLKSIVAPILDSLYQAAGYSEWPYKN